jgi:tetratricopeptide (TPR) repeat protein
MMERSATVHAFVLGMVIIFTLLCSAVVRNRIWRDPVTLWSDVASKNPGEIEVYISLGNAYLDSGMLREALGAFLYVQAREATTSIRIYPNIGNVYIAMKKYEQAEDLFSRVLAINADDELSYVGRGKARFAQGRYAAALGDFEEALRRNPAQARYYYYRGETLLRLHDRERARVDLLRSCAKGWEEACDRVQDLASDEGEHAGEPGAGAGTDGR